jgi:hypothetical protein
VAEQTTVPASGVRRWRYYAGRVLLHGLPLLWSLLSFLVGVGIVSLVVAILGLNVAWIVAAIFAGLLVVAAGGGYRVWNSEITLRQHRPSSGPRAPRRSSSISPKVRTR